MALLLAALAWAQGPPRIGLIDFYGLRKVSEARVRKALGVKEGEPLPPSKGDVEERLDKIPGVVESHLAAVCCEGGKVILYVGIEEKGAPHFDYHNPPEGKARLPDEVVETYRRFMDALQAAVAKGDAADDLTHGHSLMANPAARALQEQFIGFAAKYLKELREVLRNSDEEEQRAVAAYVIGYARRKGDIVDDLQYAIKDPDSTVRNNATRALGALAVLARLDPESGVKISPTWFIEMLNSLSWTDRNKALMALQPLTETRDPGVLEQLRERAFAALVDMARWKSLGHALPAFILLGRVAGLSEEEIQESWSRGEREKVIQKITANNRK